jgi:hypothetical protein
MYMITMRALYITAQKSVEVSYSFKITAASTLGRQIAQHRTNLGTNHFGFQSRNPKS